jgi:hypothetical protein
MRENGPTNKRSLFPIVSIVFNEWIAKGVYFEEYMLLIPIKKGTAALRRSEKVVEAVV